MQAETHRYVQQRRDFAKENEHELHSIYSLTGDHAATRSGLQEHAATPSGWQEQPHKGDRCEQLSKEIAEVSEKIARLFTLSGEQVAMTTSIRSRIDRLEQSNGAESLVTANDLHVPKQSSHWCEHMQRKYDILASRVTQIDLQLSILNVLDQSPRQNQSKLQENLDHIPDKMECATLTDMQAKLDELSRSVASLSETSDSQQHMFDRHCENTSSKLNALRECVIVSLRECVQGTTNHIVQKLTRQENRILQLEQLLGPCGSLVSSLQQKVDCAEDIKESMNSRTEFFSKINCVEKKPEEANIGCVESKLEEELLFADVLLPRPTDITLQQMIDAKDRQLHSSCIASLSSRLRDRDEEMRHLTKQAQALQQLASDPKLAEQTWRSKPKIGGA